MRRRNKEMTTYALAKLGDCCSAAQGSCESHGATCERAWRTWRLILRRQQVASAEWMLRSKEEVVMLVQQSPMEVAIKACHCSLFNPLLVGACWHSAYYRPRYIFFATERGRHIL